MSTSDRGLIDVFMDALERVNNRQAIIENNVEQIHRILVSNLSLTEIRKILKWDSDSRSWDVKR